jgi:hypothetical protein
MTYPIVTVVDPENGETQTAELAPGVHILLLGEDLMLDGYVEYANGTKVLTVKRRPKGDG